jgi:DNA-binding MarR family transcriptional regulator
MQASSETAGDDELAGALYAVMVRVARLRVEGPVDKAGMAVLHEVRLLGTVRPSDLAARMRLDLSTISRHLHALEQQGMVQRTSDPTDARAQRISLTARGSELVTRLLAHRAAMIRDAVAHWPPDDRRSLQQILCRLAGDLSRVSEASPCPTTREPASDQDPTETQ